MWVAVILLVGVTIAYASYNLLIKVSTTHIPAAVTSPIGATIALQLAALSASLIYLAYLTTRPSAVLALPTSAYLWAVAAGFSIGVAEIGYFYLFRGVSGEAPMAVNVVVPVVVCGTVAITAIAGWWLLKESFSTFQVVGTGLVACGVVLMFAGRTT
jgi:drug/metabolite transporter (DMT)-like permease